MIKILQLLLLTIISSSAVAGKLPIWEIEGTSNRVLLMGSIHYLRQADYPLPDSMLHAYELADALVMEIDMDSLDPMAVEGLMAELGTNGKTLADTLSTQGYQEANERAAKLGISLAMFDQFEPWFTALTISQLRLMQIGFDPKWGIETQLSAKAVADAKEITGLETLEYQLGMLDGLDAATQEEFLLQALEDESTMEESINTIVTAWRAGDTQTMAKSMREGFATAPQLEEALLVTRNRNWVQPIMKLRNQNDNYLIIVGTMHLVGDNSVVAMLEQRGIQVRQLSDADL
jgi:uncharacterized protein YbaP (TraB family)